MAQITYQITLSADGKHTVSATSDNPALAKASLEWAKETFADVATWQAENEGPKASFGPRDDSTATEVPICAFHRVPMVRQQGKFGAFWSCHQRNDDGGWCSYRPDERETSFSSSPSPSRRDSVRIPRKEVHLPSDQNGSSAA